jgi:outer membrane protein OmpA-like peptidoglycan-associated protein
MRGPACSHEHRVATDKSLRGDHPDSQPTCDTVRDPDGGAIRPRRPIARRLLAMSLAGGMVILAGCEPTDSVQWGYRGNSMTQLYKPGRLNELVKLNEIPPPEPSDPYDPTFPMATEVHQNVQVLTDLNALEFARLMNALSTWIAPEEGCAYCHNPENLAEDSKYTKLVARQMIKMTRDINANWSSHVVQTGVTCWTCHRGQAVPSDIWFTAPKPKTPSSGLTGWKGGQNLAGVANSGYSSLPYDPLTPFLLEETDVRVQGTEALPYGNRQSIKQTEWTYSLMMYISQSLGVNCTYCHQTRAMGRWEESTPQRVTAWHGIRMVRNINQEHLVPLLDLYPQERLGPLGDAPKAACATCHKGSYKPLFGFSMLDDYPSLRGVLPGRLSPDPTEGGTIPVAWAPEGTEVASMEERQQAAEQLAAKAAGETSTEATKTEAAAEADAETEAAAEAAPTETVSPEADASAPSAEETASEGAAAATEEQAAAPAAEPEPEKTEAQAETATAAAQGPAETAPLGLMTVPTAVGDMSVAEIEATIDALLESLREARAKLGEGTEAPTPEEAAPEPGGEAEGEAPEATPEAGQAEGEPSSAATPAADAAAAQAKVDEVTDEADAVEAHAKSLADEVEQLRAALAAKAARLEDSETSAATLDEAEALIVALNARLDQETTALEQQLEHVREQRDEAAAAATAELRSAHADAIDAAEDRLRAVQARLDQQRTALQQQLSVVRAQRDAALAEVHSRVAAREHAAMMAAAEDRIAAMEARLDQQVHALSQQLDVVRSQHDEAMAEIALRIPSEEHKAALAAVERDLAAMRARLEQQTHALGQQLEVVRAQREQAAAEALARVPRKDYQDAIDELEGRITAVQARLDQNRQALEQQLGVVRAQRDDAIAETEERLTALEDEHSEAVEALRERIKAGDARQAQERLALRQQLEVVRSQRDQASADSDGTAQTSGEQVAAAETQAEESSATEPAPEDAEAAEQESAATEAAAAVASDEAAARERALAEVAEAVGGEVTDDGLIINLGGDRLRFASGSAALPAGELPDLDRTAKLLSDYPELAARVEGHTDSVGSAALNQRLSQQRAEAVMAALVDRGVEASRLNAEGLGPDRPIASNATAEGRSRNRRVEIYITTREQVADSGSE